MCIVVPFGCPRRKNDDAMASPSNASRQKYRAAQKSGQFAEWLCRQWLRCLGYRILSHNWRNPVGELDIIAQRGETVAFVEVKYRTNNRKLEALAAITPQKQRRLVNGARHFISRHPHKAGLTLRFDVMVVVRSSIGVPRIYTIKNALQF